MAIKKIQMIPPGHIDIDHPETDSDMVLMSGGGTLTSALAEIVQDVGNIDDVTLDASLKGKSIVEMVKVNFQNADNLKNDWVAVVGTPLLNTDASATLKSKTQALKNAMASNLTAKGQASVGTESLTSLIDKIPSIITGKKWRSGTVTSNASKVVTVSGLDFTPSIILLKSAPYYYVFWVAKSGTTNYTMGSSTSFTGCSTNYGTFTLVTAVASLTFEYTAIE